MKKPMDTLNSALYGDKIRKEFFEVEPKRTHRFIVTFPEKFGIPAFVVQKIDKPKFVDGKWQNIGVEFIDLVSPSISQKLFALTNPKNYMIQIDERNWIEKITHQPIFEFLIESLDPTGVVIEKWTIAVQKVISLDFGGYDYGSDDLGKCHVVFKPKYCVLNY